MLESANMFVDFGRPPYFEPNLACLTAMEGGFNVQRGKAEIPVISSSVSNMAIFGVFDANFFIIVRRLV